MAYFDDDDSLFHVPETTPAPAPAAAGPSEADLLAIYGQHGVDTRDRSDIDAAMSGNLTLDQFRARTAARGASNGGGGGDAAPGVSSGGGSLSGAPNFMQPFSRTFTAPTLEQATSSPGFQFRLGEALKAVERSGLAKGTYFTNRTAQALQHQAGEMASAEYDKVYTRSMNEYLTDRDTHFSNEGNRYTSQRSNRLDDYTITDGNRQFDRLLGNDQWSRGADLWNMNRTDRNDDFAQNFSLEELRRRYAPRPA